MKPDKEGLWEWIDDDGKTQIVNVINVAKELNISDYNITQIRNNNISPIKS